MCPSKVQIFLSGLNAETAASIRLPLYLSSMTAWSTKQKNQKKTNLFGSLWST